MTLNDPHFREVLNCVGYWYFSKFWCMSGTSCFWNMMPDYFGMLLKESLDPHVSLQFVTPCYISQQSPRPSHNCSLKTSNSCLPLSWVYSLFIQCFILCGVIDDQEFGSRIETHFPKKYPIFYVLYSFHCFSIYLDRLDTEFFYSVHPGLIYRPIGDEIAMSIDRHWNLTF